MIMSLKYFCETVFCLYSIMLVHYVDAHRLISLYPIQLFVFIFLFMFIMFVLCFVNRIVPTFREGLYDVMTEAYRKRHNLSDYKGEFCRYQSMIVSLHSPHYFDCILQIISVW